MATIELIPFPGYAGRKKFLATLRLGDEHVRFDLKAKGFGLFATGVGFYAPIAVLGLLRHLSVKRADDEGYLNRLAAAMSLCGRAQIQREIGLANQQRLGGTYLIATCGEFLYPEPKTHTDPIGSSERPAMKPSAKAEQLAEPVSYFENHYCQLGKEFGEHFSRPDGETIARAFHTLFAQDLQEWFDDKVLPLWEALPDASWPEENQMGVTRIPRVLAG